VKKGKGGVNQPGQAGRRAAVIRFTGELKIEDLWNRSRSAGACAACRSVFFNLNRWS